MEKGITNSDLYLPREPREPKSYICPQCGHPFGDLGEILTIRNTDYAVGCNRCIESHPGNEWYGRDY